MPAPEIATDLPALERIETIDSGGGGFFVQHSEIAIGPTGLLAVPTPYGQAPMVSRPLDGPAIPFGTAGEGPGEFRLPLVYEVTDSTIVIFDRSTSRLSVWTTSGQLGQERGIRAPVVSNVAPWPGRGWLMVEAGSAGLRLFVLDNTSSRARDITPPQDSFLRTHWRNARLVSTNPPALGSWPGGVVLAQRNTYEVAFFDQAGRLAGIARPEREANVLGPEGVAALERNLAALGRPLSPARRATLLSEAQPWIRSRIRSDSAGRTWTLGQRGDSSFFDVFAGPSYLGRIPLTCPEMGSRWDLSGQWLAVICAPDDPESGLDSQVRIFRIIER